MPLSWLGIQEFIQVYPCMSFRGQRNGELIYEGPLSFGRWIGAVKYLMLSEAFISLQRDECEYFFGPSWGELEEALKKAGENI